MDDIKLYASKKNHILSLLTITENFSNDIGMSFGIDKCKINMSRSLRKFRIYRVSTLKVEHRQLTLYIQFIHTGCL
jgi:hypothetical protein